MPLEKVTYTYSVRIRARRLRPAEVLPALAAGGAAAELTGLADGDDNLDRVLRMLFVMIDVMIDEQHELAAPLDGWPISARRRSRARVGVRRQEVSSHQKKTL